MYAGVVDEAATRALRRQVLRPELGPDDPLPGDELRDGVYVGVVDGEVMVGTCLVYAEACYWRADGAGAWRLRQMASAPQRRGQGIGALVLAAAVRELRARAVDLLWCHARVEAAGFYSRQGFGLLPEAFDEGGRPHVRMWRELSGAAASS